MEIFLKKKKNIALVINELGNISGMLTIEDVIEKIFGCMCESGFEVF